MFSQPLTPNNGPAYPLPSRSQLSQDDPPSKIRVLLVDDHTMLRQALRSIVDGCANMEVVGEATNGLEAIETVTRVRPDVVVMDVNMPKMNGVEATKHIKKMFLQTSVIGLSVQDEMEIRRKMQAAGICSYLTKESAVGELCCAIEHAVLQRL